MAEHHYIIKFDDVTKVWSQDVDGEEVRFVDGTIYDETEQAWFVPYQGDSQFYRNADVIDEMFLMHIEEMNKW